MDNYACALQAFDLWGDVPVQQTIDETTVTEHRPISQIDATKPIEFEIKTAVDEYILFKETYAYFKVRVDIAKSPGSIEANDWKKVSPVNNFMHSLISQIDVQISNNIITLSPQTYAYKAYFETLLGFDDSAKKSHLTSVLWHKDITSKMDEPNESRSAFIASSDETGKTLELMGRLHIDLSFQGRAFLGGTELRLKLYPSKPEFCLMIKGNIKPVLYIESVSLFVRRAKVNPAVVQAHQQALATKPAKYPLTRGEVKRSILKKGTIDASIENVIAGKLPRRIFIAFVSNESANGSFTKNPYNFKLYDISFLSCYINGHPFPAIPYQPSEGNTLREYFSFMDAANQTGTSTYIDIDRTDYMNGFAIFGFNLSPDLSDGCGMAGHISAIREGSLRVQVVFKNALPETVTMLTYCEFDSFLQIDANRNPVVDFL